MNHARPRSWLWMVRMLRMWIAKFCNWYWMIRMERNAVVCASFLFVGHRKSTHAMSFNRDRHTKFQKCSNGKAPGTVFPEPAEPKFWLPIRKSWSFFQMITIGWYMRTAVLHPCDTEKRHVSVSKLDAGYKHCFNWTTPKVRMPCWLKCTGYCGTLQAGFAWSIFICFWNVGATKESGNVHPCQRLKWPNSKWFKKRKHPTTKEADKYDAFHKFPVVTYTPGKNAAMARHKRFATCHFGQFCLRLQYISYTIFSGCKHMRESWSLFQIKYHNSSHYEWSLLRLDTQNLPGQTLTQWQ